MINIVIHIYSSTMKKIAFVFALFLLVFSIDANAQFWNKIKKSVEKKVEEKVEEKIDEKIDETVDEAVDGKEENNNSSNSSTNLKSNSNSNTTDSEESTPKAGVLNWSKYDFVPGDMVIFEDNLLDEENGEFPTRWDIKEGNCEIAEFNGENVIMLREPSEIIPYMKERKSDYLPDEFTLEFDCFFETNEWSQRYYISFYDQKNQRNLTDNQISNTLTIYYGAMDFHNLEGKYPGVNRTNKAPKETWRHISISYNRGNMKMYMDDTRLINLPRLEGNPTGFTFANSSDANKNFIKNVRFAKGAVKLSKRVETEGKIIMQGIRFDVNKATLKPESMGPINKIFKMMDKDESLKFSVEGHTDSDGDDASNLKLSADRAKAVVDKLVELGIDSSRLKYKGLGDTMPIGDNTTPEGKANNRRVEFIKF